MKFLLIVGMVVGSSLFQIANGKTAGFVQSSFISTDGGTASGAAESSVTGPDGIRKGECSYTDTEGRSVTITYEEGPNGEVSATTKATHVDNPKAELLKCRQSIAALQQGVSQSIEENQKNVNEQMDQFERMFQNQMSMFNRQQQSFAQQHLAFLKQMDDFNKKFQGFSGIWK